LEYEDIILTTNFAYFGQLSVERLYIFQEKVYNAVMM